MAYIPTANITDGSWDDGNPSELDYLKPNGFKFLVHNLPNVSFFCQSANIPDIVLGEARVSTPLLDYMEPGEKISYGVLNLRFLIQENLNNYNELLRWLEGLGSPQSSEQYAAYARSQAYRFPASIPGKTTAAHFKSDASLFVLDSNNNPVAKITFKDCFPIALGALEFDLTETEYFIGSTQFRYLSYQIEAM